MPVYIVFDRSCVEGLAVMEFDARAKLDDQAFLVVGPLPGGSELRNDLELQADIEQFVAQCSTDNAAHERAA